MSKNFTLLQKYNLIRKDPSSLIKNPSWIIFLPGYIYIFFQKRWKTEPEYIYLTETKIKYHPLLKKTLNPACSIKTIINFEKAIPLIKKRIEEKEDFEKYKKEVLKRFQVGDYLIALCRDNEFAGYLFISEQVADISQLKHQVKLDKNCFAVYDVYTFKKFRGEKIYENLLSEVFRQFTERGFTKCWLWVMKHNQLSLKVHQKLTISHVIKIFVGYHRFGFRRLSIRDADFSLSELIDK